MLITLSADLHLSNRLEHPERYMALLSILDAMQQEGQHSIILAGDTFDASYQNYADFDMICQKFPAISFYIIPGNHDPHINKRDIISQNVTIFTKPEVVSLEPGGTPFLFVPYEKNKTIGERIAEFSAQLVPDQWVLIAHGDYMEGIQTPNPYEGGTYMPITRKDLLTFRPAKVFLGHIHAALCKDPVYYCGSPCGLDISETGWRSYLVFESRSGLVQSKPINSKFLYFDETLTILPVQDEQTELRKKAHAIIQNWGITPVDYPKVRLRLKINGYSEDKNNALTILKDCFSPFQFYKNEDIDSAGLNISRDSDRSMLAEIVNQSISEQTFLLGEDQPTRDDILLSALQIIYGAKNGSSH